MACPFLKGCVIGSKGRMWAVTATMCAAAATVWAFRVSLWAVTAPIWNVTTIIWPIIASVWTVTDSVWAVAVAVVTTQIPPQCRLFKKQKNGCVFNARSYLANTGNLF